MFWNGNLVASKNANYTDVIGLMKNNHTVYDIGMKRDGGSALTFKGFLKELMIFNRALNEEELEAIKGMSVMAHLKWAYNAGIGININNYTLFYI